MIDLKLVVTPESASELLGISCSTLAKMRIAGTGPVFTKLGSRVLYRGEDLAEWISANRYKSTSEYSAGQGDRRDSTSAD